MKLTNFYGKPCDISTYLDLYKEGKHREVAEWLWSELYHQNNIGTASVAWVIEANSIFLRKSEIDWTYLGFIYAVMESLEEHKSIPCPRWAEGRCRIAAIRSLQYVLGAFPDAPTEEQRMAIVCISCAISGMYKSYSLIEYAWGGYEERLMELDLEVKP